MQEGALLARRYGSGVHELLADNEGSYTLSQPTIGANRERWVEPRLTIEFCTNMALLCLQNSLELLIGTQSRAIPLRFISYSNLCASSRFPNTCDPTGHSGAQGPHLRQLSR